MNDHTLKIIFTLDGSGIYFDPNEPIHLDALLAWSIAPFITTKRHISRDDIPEYVPLPLSKYYFENGAWCWCASALMPDGNNAETLRFWRKRFRQNRIELTQGSPNLTNGPYREWNMPMPIMLTHTMVAYAKGNRRLLLKELKRIKYLGKKRAYGFGKVVSVSVAHIDEDNSIASNGLAMRWLPAVDGARYVRLTPPYWNRHDRVNCCNVGDEINLGGL